MSGVAITGMGVLLAGCDSPQTMWRQLRQAQPQLTLQPDPLNGAKSRPMGYIKEFDARKYLNDFPESFYRHCPRDVQLYLASLMLARQDAAVDLRRVNTDRVGVFDGTSRGSFDYWHDAWRSDAAIDRRTLAYATPGQAVGVGTAMLGLHGPAYTFVASCSSAAVALGQAVAELTADRLDLAFVTGHESALNPCIYRMYADAGLLSAVRTDPAQALRPYGRHSGNVFGEGAVTVVLEQPVHASRRRASVYSYVEEYGYANTGEHPTHVDSNGRRAIDISRRALAGAGLGPDDVDFVVGHGNAVLASDRAEMAMMRGLFGTRAHEVPLLSTKPIYGHTLGAAAAVNIAAAGLALQHRRIFPTANVDLELAPSDLSFQPSSNRQRCEVGLVMSFGLGGHNTVVVMRGRRGETR